MAATIFGSVLIIFLVFLLIGLIMWMINSEIFCEESPFYWLTRKRDPNKIFLDFDNFMNLRRINPRRWGWGRYDYVECWDKKNHQTYRLFMRSFFDSLKLLYARKHKSDIDDKKERNKCIEELEKIWMEDIENFKRNGGNE